MKKIFLLLFLFAIAPLLHAQPPTNAGEFTYLGKKYTANYDTGKHQLTFSEEVSFEIYDDTGNCVK
ncbi:MAG TPA: hypothetical protein VFU15_11335, partial [Bacteroidia bacterium]|nr:hypothetical protein [Bacteroidia bacterium]